MDLPTDVLLRTTDYQGSLVVELHDLSTDWVFAAPLEPKDSAFMFEPSLDASDEFSVALFMAVHGWYQQALSTLRSALATLTFGAAFAVRQDVQLFQDWRTAKHEPKFANHREMLAAAPALQPIEQTLPNGGLFGINPDGVLRGLYQALNPYVHAQADSANGAIWQSNGPVWVPDAFDHFGMMYRDTMAMGYILLKIGWPSFTIPDKTWTLFGGPTGALNNVPTALLKQHFG